jgi:hypothetical protein
LILSQLLLLVVPKKLLRRSVLRLQPSLRPCSSLLLLRPCSNLLLLRPCSSLLLLRPCSCLRLSVGLMYVRVLTRGRSALGSSLRL